VASKKHVARTTKKLTAQRSAPLRSPELKARMLAPSTAVMAGGAHERNVRVSNFHWGRAPA
jgi:hypothetical protein